MPFNPDRLNVVLDSIGGEALRIHHLDAEGDSEGDVLSPGYIQGARQRGVRAGDMIVISLGGSTRLATIVGFTPSGGGTVVFDEIAGPQGPPGIPAPIGMACGAIEMAWLGDSRTANGSFTAPNRLMASGPQFWTEFHSQCRVISPLEYNFGVAGETSTQIAARIDSVVDCPATIVHVCCGTNDSTGAPTFANIMTIINALRQPLINKTVIVSPELPRQVGLTADRVAQQTSIRDKLLNLKMDGVYVVDPWPYLIDPTQSSGVQRPGVYFDDLHLTTLGAYYWGLAIAEIINRIVPPTNVLPVSPVGYNAVYNPAGILNPNPLGYGTAGTFQGGATGTAPDGVNVRRDGTDITVTSTAQVTSNGKQWHEITLAGTATSTTQSVTIRQEINLANISVGDVLEAVLEIEVDEGAIGVRGPTLALIGSLGSIASSYANYDTAVSNLGPIPGMAHSGILRAPHLEVASGLTSLYHQIQVRAENGNPADITFRIRASAVRKVL